MAALDKISASLAALDAKVTAHLDADGQAVLEMTAKVQALQADNAAKDAKIAELEAGAVTPEEVDAVAAQADAIGARL